MKDFKNSTVGAIVADNIEYAKVFRRCGVDFCCGGDKTLVEAVNGDASLLDKVIDQLESVVISETTSALDFNQWPIDLLIDYVVKYHHNYIREEGPIIAPLLKSVIDAHGELNPSLYEVKELFDQALIDLHNHFDKEENILFPIIREILEAEKQGGKLPEFHCGSIENPIRVMIEEHDNEGERFRKIAELTNEYTPPVGACDSYRLVLRELKRFEENLHIHIHVENNILFPKALKVEESL